MQPRCRPAPGDGRARLETPVKEIAFCDLLQARSHPRIQGILETPVGEITLCGGHPSGVLQVIDEALETPIRDITFCDAWPGGDSLAKAFSYLKPL